MNAAFSSISFLLSVSLQEEISYDTPISLFIIFFFLLFSLLSFISISHPSFLAIFVILLLLLKDNKILGDFRANRYHP